MAGEVFADGEPVDPKKLQNLQNQIDLIKDRSDESYNLSKTTAGDIETLGIHHIRAGEVEFENGIDAKKTESVDIQPGWGSEYTQAFVVASPRLTQPGKSLIRWSLSGSATAGGVTKLNVYAEAKISGPFKFHWISAAIKPSTL